MHSARSASILAARRAHIYVGIFGEEYSDTTEKEFDEAYSERKPCLIYAKEVKARDELLEKLLREKIKPEFKMHTFKSREELYQVVLQNLEEHLLELLMLGLEKYKEERSDTLRSAEKSNLLVAKAIENKQTSFPEEMLRQAKSHFDVKDYAAVALKASMSLEAWLVLQLEEQGVRRPANSTLGHLLNLALEKKIITEFEANRLTEVRIIRNATIHEARIPTRETSEFVLQTVSEILGEESDS